MCLVAKIASCEISFIPVQSSDYISDVDKVLALICASGLEHTVGLLSTTVRGSFEKILALVKEIYLIMDDSCSFTMDVKLSNICGCYN